MEIIEEQGNLIGELCKEAKEVKEWKDFMKRGMSSGEETKEKQIEECKFIVGQSPTDTTHKTLRGICSKLNAIEQRIKE